MVTETKEKPQSQDTPLVKEPEQSSVDKKVTPKKEKTYSEAEFTEKVLNVNSENGRLKKDLEAATKERDTFKTQAKEATDTLEETRQHISNLESDIETLEESETDPNKLSRLRRELRDAKGKVSQEVKEEREANAELKRTLESEREEWAGTVAEAQTFKFDGEVAKIVDEYDGDVTANFTKLKDVCEKSGIKTKEGAEAIAETFMTKKPEVPDVLNDSGVTSGGSEDLNNLSSKELRTQAYKTKKR